MSTGKTISIFALIIYVVATVFGGWAAVVTILMPYVAIPAAFVIAGIFFLAFEGLAASLRKFNQLNFLNLLVACAILSFALGFLPWTAVSQRHPGPMSILLEDYAMGLVFYASLLNVLAPIWWSSYTARQAQRK